MVQNRNVIRLGKQSLQSQQCSLYPLQAAKAAAWLGMLRQNSINSSGTWHPVWYLVLRVTTPCNIKQPHLCEYKPLSSDSLPKSTALHSLCFFFLVLFTNIYLLCKIKQVSLWTRKLSLPAGLCVFDCINLHSIKLQYL